MIVLTIIFFSSVYVAEGQFVVSKPYLLLLTIYLSTWPIISYLNKDYKIGRAVSYYTTFKKAFFSVFIFISVISIFWLFSESESLERHFLTTLVLLLFLWLTIYRVSVHLVLDKYREFGGNIRYAIILGYDDLGTKLFETLKKKSHYGIRCLGFYGDPNSKNQEYSYLGDFKDFLKANLDNVDHIYVSERAPKYVLERAIEIGESSLKRVKLLPEFKTEAIKNFVLRRYDAVPVIDVNNLPLDAKVNTFVKRAFDVVFAFLIFVFFLSWMYPVFGLIIKLESKGPILFKQLRHGKGNTPFYCYKFRTMVKNNESDFVWASKNDPRITRFGTFLRKTSLDEFPQFFNVLIGNMSIVGPRPHPLSLNKAYESKIEKYAKRHAYKPGVTGLAQAMGFRGEITDYYQMNSRVRLDRFYLQNWSFVLDIKIIFLTIYALMKGQKLAY
ncbi:exopolysaccharide biosynthesis polyprenyl glycosylphosphotransferase [Roseivirga sp.]|uniref:exopolysaccharide biosynthesis polyprenyl glycosylphosphotransferase n=1 Tax=Roseivirga sp. TaxID=1964215 RepID=UPI002B2739F9|nr:exopolysaccharide biosynthesis polyprenyl glycosylphosphotransferase [Roseivirga sp.]